MRWRWAAVGTLLAVHAPDAVSALDLKATLEVGSELDSNPHRLSVNEDDDMGFAGRGGGRIAVEWRRGTSERLLASAAVWAKRFVDLAYDDEPQEDAAVLVGSIRSDKIIASQALALSGQLNFYDAFEATSASAFRTGDGGLTVALLGPSSHRLLATLGYRAFEYKPDQSYDFRGPMAAITYSYSHVIGDPEVSLDVQIAYSASKRRFDANALINVCEEESAPDPSCRIETAEPRVDLLHLGAVEIAYRGPHILSARYELHANSSTSFGSSLLRHRLELAGTTELPGKLFLTGKLVAQYNLYGEPLLLSQDVDTFDSIADESRNSLVFHVSRDIGNAWTIEGRYALYASTLGGGDWEYNRQTVYVGAVFTYP